MTASAIFPARTATRRRRERPLDDGATAELGCAVPTCLSSTTLVLTLPWKLAESGLLLDVYPREASSPRFCSTTEVHCRRSVYLRGRECSLGRKMRSSWGRASSAGELPRE